MTSSKDAAQTPATAEAARAQAADRAAGGDGCCHKTRLRGSGCPLGWKCPYVEDWVRAVFQPLPPDEATALREVLGDE